MLEPVFKPITDETENDQGISNQITESQLQAHWMAFTGNRQFKKDPRIITAADGAYFYDSKGRKVFDALSGLWTCGLGHNVPEINNAVAEQIKTLDYSPSFQFGHPRSFQLAEKILEFMPEGFTRVFYTGSGSESCETAMKIARAYWKKKGRPSKTKFIGRILGYHGVNFGGIGVGGIPANRLMFGSSIETDHLSSTVIPGNEFSRGLPTKGAELADELEQKILFHGAENIAALVVEPMSGSAGVLPPPKGYLERLVKIARKHDVLVVFDEVICAFGRLGANTGSEYFKVTPDIVTLAKQITNGAIPLGAVAVKEHIYEAFMEEAGPDYAVEMPHGYTFSAHPVACAAGLASLKVLQRDGLIERVKAHSSYFEDAVHSLRHHSMIIDIRNLGFAAGLTFAHRDDHPMGRTFDIAMKLFYQGYYVRYANDTIQLGLPFITTKDQIDALIDAMDKAISLTH